MTSYRKLWNSANGSARSRCFSDYRISSIDYAGWNLYIEDYFQQVQQAIKTCSIVAEFSWDAEKRDTYEGFIRAEIRFTDGSILQVREFVAIETAIDRDM
jgi:hypothetical protein